MRIKERCSITWRCSLSFFFRKKVSISAMFLFDANYRLTPFIFILPTRRSVSSTTICSHCTWSVNFKSSTLIIETLLSFRFVSNDQREYSVGISQDFKWVSTPNIIVLFSPSYIRLNMAFGTIFLKYEGFVLFLNLFSKPGIEVLSQNMGLFVSIIVLFTKTNSPKIPT